MAPFVAVLRRTAGGLGVKVARTLASDLFLRDASPKCLSTYMGLWPRHITQYLCYGSSSLVQRRRLSLVTASVSSLDEEPEVKPYGDSKSDSALAMQVRGTQEVELPAAAKPIPRKKMSLHALHRKYLRREPLSMITAYDYPSARLADGSGADMLLVGDSLGMVVLGQKDTTEVTVSQMVHHCQAAARGTSRALLVADLPFGSYLTEEMAALNGVRLIKEGRADAVKLEGGKQVLKQVRALIDAGVAVMGHVGFTPQSHSQLGGYRVQGRTAKQARRLLDDSRALAEAGCFALVLEMVPAPVAALITHEIGIPTIGIGAGGGTSGQVQVFHDLLGLYDKVVPRFSRQFAELEAPMREALTSYCDAVKNRTFPAPKHCFGMAPAEVERLEAEFGHALGDGGGNSGEITRDTSKVAESRRVSAAGGGGSGIFNEGGNCPGGSEGLIVVHSIEEWRALSRSPRLSGSVSLGLVPTMGALHDGHMALVQRAKSEADIVVTSIFVNPTQFGKGEDFDKYPRTWEDDVSKLRAAGVDILFAPSPSEMYPRGPSAPAVFVDFDGFQGAAEAVRRPGHFRGVATVVSKLLNIVKPTDVYFGQKDGLQCVLVKRLVSDLNFDTRVVVHPTIREPDGLAMSSRNRYLTAEERDSAPAVYAALEAVAAAHKSGERNVDELRRAARVVVSAQPKMQLEYISLADAATGREVDEAGRPSIPKGIELMASIAVRLGTTRLIDNIILTP